MLGVIFLNSLCHRPHPHPHHPPPHFMDMRVVGPGMGKGYNDKKTHVCCKSNTVYFTSNTVCFIVGELI